MKALPLVMRFWLLLFFLTAPFAHAEPVSIGILKFQHPRSVDEAHVRMVEQFVTSKFSAANRFSLIERSRMDAIESERFLQMLNDVENPASAIDIGASFVVFGDVTQVGIIRERLDGGSIIYTANIVYSVRILDVSSGKVAYAEHFSTSRDGMLKNFFSAFSGDNSTPQGALDIALRQTSTQLDKFLTKAFPVRGQVVSIEKADKRGKPALVLVSLGSADGINKKSKLTVYTEEAVSVGGQVLVRKKTLAELIYDRSEGDRLSLFKVKSGGENLIGVMMNDRVPLFAEVKTE